MNTCENIRFRSTQGALYGATQGVIIATAVAGGLGVLCTAETLVRAVGCEPVLPLSSSDCQMPCFRLISNCEGIPAICLKVVLVFAGIVTILGAVGGALRGVAETQSKI